MAVDAQRVAELVGGNRLQVTWCQAARGQFHIRLLEYGAGEAHACAARRSRVGGDRRPRLEGDDNVGLRPGADEAVLDDAVRRLDPLVERGQKTLLARVRRYVRRRNANTDGEPRPVQQFHARNARIVQREVTGGRGRRGQRRQNGSPEPRQRQETRKKPSVDIHQRIQQGRTLTGSEDDAGQLRARSGAEYPLADRTLSIGGGDWTITATPSQDPLLAGIKTDADLAVFPYGLLLWPSAIGLAEHLAARPALVCGKRVLELGAGVGLPGIVAQYLGGHVTQTDFQDEPLALARHNAMQNGVSGIHTLQADWRQFPTLPLFPVVIGSDVLYERSLHGVLLRLFDTVLAPGGLLILADPLRPAALEFADALEHRGWRLELESREVNWKDRRQEIALFTAPRD